VTTATLALIIVFAIVAQVVIFALVRLFRRKSQSSSRFTDEDNRRNTSPAETRVGPKIDIPVSAGRAWEDLREFLVERRVSENMDGSICSLYLVPADGKPLPPYRPGQFLTFKLPVENQIAGETKDVIRCYSLSDSPSPDRYRITVKRVITPADRPELPPGLSSNYLHGQVQQGDRLLVKAPSGHFHLTDGDSLPIVLIGGGIGITPMLSILNTLCDRNNDREIWLFYGVRNGDEQIMEEHLKRLASEMENLHVYLCYSSPKPNDQKGVDYQHRGRVDIALLRSTLKLARYQFYVCGPRSMMEDMIPGLEDWGVANEDIYYESFGPATLNRPDRKTLSSGVISGSEITVSFSNSGIQASWDANATSLLEFAEDHGVPVESGCRAGSCGSCQTPLDAGEVEYSQHADAEVQPGHCLLCISTPKNHITLRV